MRRISFALTPEQCRARTKTETRRLGWRYARIGDELLAVSKVMGFRKGETIDGQVETFGTIRLVEVRREPLSAITQEGVVAEGFPHLTPPEFVEMFRSLNAGTLARDEVTVLRFVWVGP